MKYSGFSIVEVMIAIAIIGIALVAIGRLEMTLLRTTVKSSDDIQRSNVMQQFLYEARMQTQEHFSKKGDEPVLTLSYSRTPVAKESALASIQDLLVERVEARFERAGHERRETFVAFVYKKSPEKKDDARKGAR